MLASIVTDPSAAAPGGAASACTRVVWASVWMPAGSAVDALLALRGPLLARNRPAGLRSALLHCAGWLVQWHEGPADAVRAAWAETEADPSHRQARVLHASHGPGNLQEPVQVSTLHAGDRPSDMALRLHRLRREGEQGWAAEPVEIWQALCAPSLLAGGDGVGLLARRNVMALASEDNESVEMLRALAQRCGVRLAYQRHAGCDVRRADVGSAYADLPVSLSVVTRVMALSRRALEQPLACLASRELQHLVVLVGPNGRRAEELMGELAGLLRRLPTRPPVLLVAASEAAGLAAQAALAARTRQLAPLHVAATRQAQRELLLRLAHGGEERPFFNAYVPAGESAAVPARVGPRD